jgi:predicted deacylase
VALSIGSIEEKPTDLRLCGERVPLGSRIELTLPVAESYSGDDVELPVHVWRGPTPGPAVLISAAVHGDELNGIGIIRRLILNPPFVLKAGTLVFVPVVNLLGYERHSRYLPDRRDLNRVFPGSERGSLARRYAHRFFDEIVRRCDFGIDFHTAAVRRVNYPNVRGDLRVEHSEADVQSTAQRQSSHELESTGCVHVQGPPVLALPDFRVDTDRTGGIGGFLGNHAHGDHIEGCGLPGPARFRLGEQGELPPHTGP